MLVRWGFENVEGVDVAPAPRLVTRAKEEQPGARFTVLTSPPQLDHQALRSCPPAHAPALHKRRTNHTV
ncbi:MULTISPECIES: hypothetical protein [unclassified Micromonospora]|uniref:hypothetical protein n=1 Tax=unclassified Micromonospora TaxID=2617518 RepID=UPI0020B1A7E5|nr:MULTISPECIES: hypothetical protein [unclassified Micromonospora]MDM4782959.1 hypothetical protein [Micromonospora sp. b486]